MKTPFEHKPNSGYTFTNTNDPTKVPPGITPSDESGKALIVCTHCGENSLFYHDLWKNVGESGQPFSRHRFKPVGGAPKISKPPSGSAVQRFPQVGLAAKPSTPDEFNDDIPF